MAIVLVQICLQGSLQASLHTEGRPLAFPHTPSSSNAPIHTLLPALIWLQPAPSGRVATSPAPDLDKMARQRSGELVRHGSVWILRACMMDQHATVQQRVTEATSRRATRRCCPPVADSFTRPCPALLTATAPAPARSSSAAASRPKPAASSSAAPASAYPHAQPAQAAAPASSGGWFSRPAAPPPAPSGT